MITKSSTKRTDSASRIIRASVHGRFLELAHTTLYCTSFRDEEHHGNQGRSLGLGTKE
jgi:hypothetical protein